MAIVASSPLSENEFSDLVDVAVSRGKMHLLIAPILSLRAAQGLPGATLTLLASLQGDDDSADIARALYEDLSSKNRAVFRSMLDKEIVQMLSREDSTDAPELTQAGLRDSLIADLGEIRDNWLPQAPRKAFDANKAVAVDLGDTLAIDLGDSWRFDYGGKGIWSFVQDYGFEQLAFHYVRGVRSFDIVPTSIDAEEVSVYGWPDESGILV